VAGKLAMNGPKVKPQREICADMLKIVYGQRLPFDIVDSQTGEIVIPAFRKVTKTAWNKAFKHPYEAKGTDGTLLNMKISEMNDETLGNLYVCLKYDQLRVQREAQALEIDAKLQVVIQEIELRMMQSK
jgi:hypothetical protein